jgi:hypothetical protein
MLCHVTLYMSCYVHVMSRYVMLCHVTLCYVMFPCVLMAELKVHCKVGMGLCCDVMVALGRLQVLVVPSFQLCCVMSWLPALRYVMLRCVVLRSVMLCYGCYEINAELWCDVMVALRISEVLVAPLYVRLRSAMLCHAIQRNVMLCYVCHKMYHKSFTRVTRECYKSVKCYPSAMPSASTLSVLAAAASPKSYESVTRVLQECYKSVTRVLQGCNKSVTTVLRECQECYKTSCASARRVKRMWVALVGLVGSVRLVRLVGLVSLVGLVGLARLVALAE